MSFHTGQVALSLKSCQYSMLRFSSENLSSVILYKLAAEGVDVDCPRMSDCTCLLASKMGILDFAKSILTVNRGEVSPHTSEGHCFVGEVGCGCVYLVGDLILILLSF